MTIFPININSGSKSIHQESRKCIELHISTISPFTMAISYNGEFVHVFLTITKPRKPNTVLLKAITHKFYIKKFFDNTY